MENRYGQTAPMSSSTYNKRPAQWLALHFPGVETARADGIRTVDPAALQRLASWCYQYSSQVCIVAERNSLLLEVSASRRLFGDAETLAERIHTELEQLGYHASSGIAPTPECAQLAARHKLSVPVTGDIRKMIGTLGIESLFLQDGQIRALQKMGFRNVHDILRLPRKALARRLGPALGDYLDRLLGQRPDPCKSFQPADNFCAGTDLPETVHTQGLIFPLKRLLQELCGVLRAHDRAIQVLEVRLKMDGGVQSFTLTLQHTTRSEPHLMMLLRERLERLRLASPVYHVLIQAAHFLSYVECQPDLLAEAGKASATTDNTVFERLQARLGTHAITGLNGRQDHRPEHSWSLRKPGEPAACTRLPQRPAWLLPKPQRCLIAHYRILAGPERIESGWWDGRDCRRDYFVVRDPNGSTLWAFHEYKPHPGWYLHGLFA
jgi:protein ImuB